MYKKEISELRRRFRYQKNNINRIYGCYVGMDKQMGEVFTTTLDMLAEEHVDSLLGNFRKVLSSQIDKSFRELEFSIEEITGGSCHGRLMEMKKNSLKDIEQVKSIFADIAEEVRLDTPYMILMTFEAFDLMRKSHDAMDDIEGEEGRFSNDMFSFITCSVCPVKETLPSLEYKFPDQLVQGGEMKAVKAPELGFVFPAFTDFATDIYHVWFYSRDNKKSWDSLTEKLFNITPPAPPVAQREGFSQLLEETLEPSLSTVVDLQLKCAEAVEDAKILETNPTLTKKAVLETIIEDEDISEEQKESFSKAFDEKYGNNAELNPEVLLPSKGIKLKGDGYSISIDLEYLQMVQIQEINGIRVLTIPLNDGTEVNGIKVKK